MKPRRQYQHKAKAEQGAKHFRSQRPTKEDERLREVRDIMYDLSVARTVEELDRVYQLGTAYFTEKETLAAAVLALSRREALKRPAKAACGQSESLSLKAQP